MVLASGWYSWRTDWDDPSNGMPEEQTFGAHKSMRAVRDDVELLPLPMYHTQPCMDVEC